MVSLFLYTFLISMWLLVKVLESLGLLPSIELVIVFYAVINALETIVIWRDGDKIHNYSFSALHFYILSSTLFFLVMPTASILFNYHFILDETSIHGIAKLLELNFWLLIIYFLIYRRVIGNSQLTTTLESLPNVHHRTNFKIAFFGFTAAVIGVTSFIYLYLTSPQIWGAGYEEIGVSIRGQGWILRFGELLAIGGLLIVVAGKEGASRKFIYLGVSIIIIYAVLRMPFQNRENVIKYFIVLFIYFQLLSQARIPYKIILRWSIAIVALVSILPIFSAMRGGPQSGELGEVYKYYIFRDLNFSEIPSALLSDTQYSSEISIGEGFLKSFGMLIPRTLWPDKPYTLSVDITSWLTPVKGYDIDNPTFAYAPTYIGYAYVIGGYAAIIFLVIIVASFIAIVVRNSRKPGKYMWRLDAMIASLLIYYGTIAFHKLDPGTIITALIIPIFYLSIVVLCMKLRSSKLSAR